MLDEADVYIRRREPPYTDDKGINLFGSTSAGLSFAVGWEICNLCTPMLLTRRSQGSPCV
jgi:hypothetical protein